VRIEVDRDVCEGVGMCESMAHEFFAVDDDDVLEVLRADVPPERAGEVRSAVAACPVQALRLAE